MKLAYEQRTASGYEAGLRGEGQVGQIDIGVSVDASVAPAPAVGLSAEGPVIGRILLGLFLEPDGGAQVASVTREVNGKSVHSRPLREREGALDALRAERAALEAERDAANELRELAEQAAKTVSDELGRVRTEVAALQQTADALRSELAKVRYERESLKAEGEALRDRVATSEVEVAEAHKLREGDFARVSEELAAAQAEAARAGATVQAKDRELERLRSEIERRRAEKADLQQALADREAELDQWRAQGGTELAPTEAASTETSVSEWMPPPESEVTTTVGEAAPADAEVEVTTPGFRPKDS